jgi:DnaJ like chaperone protein
MLWPATLLGALAGLALASIPGALLGGLLGQVLDRRLALRNWDDVRRLFGRPLPAADNELLFLVLGQLAKSDGPVLPAHIQCAQAEMRRLKLDEPARRAAIDAFNRGKLGQVSLRSSLRPLRTQPHAAEALLRAGWRMAWADARVGSRERELLLLWGSWMGWRLVDVERLGKPSRSSGAGSTPVAARGAYEDALRLLGLTDDSDAAAIKRAYRRLLSRHHPDKLAGTGASAERIREATEKTGELHKAYRLIRERRNLR